MAPARREIDPRWIFLMAALMLAGLPFAAVDYAPATDLPQHAAQIRLLRELWGLAPPTMDLDALVARPFGANTLCYWPLLLLGSFLPAHLAAKLALLGWIGVAVAALHVVAWRRARPAWHALLAGCLLFGLPLYWGLLNFISGIGPFVLFVERALRPRTSARTPGELAVDAGWLALLYLAHVLWLAAALLLVAAVASRRAVASRDARGVLGWAAAALPVLLLSLPWWSDLLTGRAATGVEMGPQYLRSFGERLLPSFWLGSTFGGLRGPLEPVMVLGLVAYAACSVVAARRSPRQAWDRPLLAMGLSGIAFAWLAPDKYLNTILFNDRFLGCGVMFVVLALPAGQGRGVPAFAAVASLLFSLATTAAWVVFDQHELSGLRAALAGVDGPRSVLGLDYRKRSEVLRDRPYLQLFAYAQAEHGGDLAFSFAQHRSSIVSYRSPAAPPWTPGLEWLPERASARDVTAFDCVLVNGTPEQHAAFEARFGRYSSAREGFFRMYCRGTSGDSAR